MEKYITFADPVLVDTLNRSSYTPSLKNQLINSEGIIMNQSVGVCLDILLTN